MRVAIHQPEHMPWLGFFHKMADCDVYVLLDNVQFARGNFQNRNRLVDKSGSIIWSTVPVRISGYMNKRIIDIELDNRQPWRRKTWARISDIYRNHDYFKIYAPELESIFMGSHEYLVELNLDLIEFFRRQLNITVPMFQSSKMNVKGSRSELLLAICKSIGADTYLSGPSGHDYLDKQIFASAGVALDYHIFKHPEYPAPIFHPYLSTLDLLFNCGPRSPDILGLSKSYIGI